MKLSQIEAFVATAELGSLSQAARKLDKNRTTLSMALSSLEDELGVVLFNRTRNQITLTEIGESILTDSRNLLMLADGIEQKCLHFQAGEENELRVARDDSLPEGWWSEQLFKLDEAFPETSVSAILCSSLDLPYLVASGRVDIGYGIKPIEQLDPKVNVRCLSRIRSLGVAAQSHPLAKLKQVENTDLAPYTHVCYSHVRSETPPLYEPLSKRSFRYNTYKDMEETILHGLGWGILPEPRIKDYLRQEKLMMIRHPEAMLWEDYVEVTPASKPLGKVGQWLSEQLGDLLAELY